MFDVEGQRYNAYWVDEKQPLFIPNEPLHWKAHKLQILLEILTKQAQKNPAQFNSKNYIDTLESFTITIEKIKFIAGGGKLEDENLDPKNVAGERAGRKEAATMGAGATLSVDTGISTNNPLAGQGPDTPGTVGISAGVSELPGPVPGGQQA